MKLNEIIGFMNPLSDVLSGVFVVTMLLASIGSVIWLIKSARPVSWEKNWQGENLDEDNQNLDDEHGSVHELSDAVATKAEKVAELMPSMLLVFGLLGTFLGLGMALNHASSVLANVSTTGMDGAMAQLLGMMDGLGAKFKTSTWGILCFIALNIIFNVKGTSEQRLAWVIKQVRKGSNAKKMAMQKKQDQKQLQLLEALSKINETSLVSANQLSTVLASGLEKSDQNNFALHSNIFKKTSEIFIQLADLQKNSNQNLLTTLTNLNERSNLNIKELIFGLNNDIQSNNQFMKNSYTQSQELQKQNHENLILLLSQSNQDSLNKQEACSIQLITELQKNSQQIEINSQNNLDELKKIAQYNQETQQSMQNFVDKTVASMANIGVAADKIAESASAVGDAASDLNGVVSKLQSELNQVMGTIKRDLGETITGMGSSFKENMANMSDAMGIATNGISKSVNELSQSVDKTLATVSTVIGESMELQRKSSNTFTETSENLNGQIIGMTLLVEKLTDDITSSLKSVAESSNRMRSLVKTFEETSKSVSEVPPKMESLVVSNQEVSHQLINGFNDIKKSYDTLQENGNTINTLLDQLLKLIETNQVGHEKHIGINFNSLSKLEKIEDFTRQLVDLGQERQVATSIARP